MGQLYASLKTGHVAASVALKRLVGFSAKNRFYRANRDLGRIFKTEFILQYLSEPELRRRIRGGLLKVEQLRALPRDVFYWARPDQRPRAVGADEHLHLPEPNPGVHRLLAGVRNLPGPE
jgi:TnpA family transposase